MSTENKKNVHYFESTSMRELYGQMEDWQNENRKRLLSISIQRDEGKFCCIALTNPTEVVIMNSAGTNAVKVGDDGCLQVWNQNS